MRGEEVADDVLVYNVTHRLRGRPSGYGNPLAAWLNSVDDQWGLWLMARDVEEHLYFSSKSWSRP